MSYQRQQYLVLMRREIRRLGLEAVISDNEHFRDFAEMQILSGEPYLGLGAFRELSLQRMKQCGEGDEDLAALKINRADLRSLPNPS